MTEGLESAFRAVRRLGGFDRVFAFQADRNEDGENVVTLRAESVQISVPALADVSSEWLCCREADFPEVFAELRAGRVWHSLQSQRVGTNARLNKAAQSKSDLILPVFDGAKFWGCVGFDICGEERAFTAAEVEVLKGLSEAISAAVRREALELAAREAVAREREKQARLRAAELARANSTLRRTVDSLAREKDLARALGMS